jgi:hypothetical protein
MLSPSSSSASDELRDTMKQLAKRVLASAKSSPVRVGVFSPVGQDNTNSGPGFEAVLTDELNAIRKGAVRTDARIEVKGEYAFAKSRKQSGLKVIKVTAKVVDLDFAEDLEEIDFKVELSGTKTIAEILQLTGAIPDRKPDGTQATKHERNELLDKLNRKPSAHLHGSSKTKVSSSASSPYAVEIAVRPLKGSDAGLKPRAASVNGKGLAFIPINRDEVYEPRIHNNSDADVAIFASIDGVDVFHFSSERNEDGRSKYTSFIIPKNSSGPIPGWFQKLATPNNYLSFLVTGYGQGAITKAGLKSRGKVGIIHVQFSSCYKLGPGQHARSGNETGFGPPKSVQQKAVRYEIEAPHEFVSIRYQRE